ncbi:BspA family leucine-rich repeat surface protein [Bifidobacterium sp. ESL0790]|uniref:BspA family leucine-rich repeat surface protein n=1 Tax=Bifidobacterium sp. ESL0790 TaxID=2983233 RepID=UPI0023F8EEB5|nr:BspA family leucine-rich repeat surface protein [Bifidobacterium sp. ESL0790]WEV72820.1 BspA family leucine-rich repeat surface protein [Bifidobacterium sp. ESL0790]
MAHHATSTEQPQVGPQSSCTPTTATWQGSAHGGPTADHIDWTIDANCNMTITGGILNYDYPYYTSPFPWSVYRYQITSLTISSSLQLSSGVTTMNFWFSNMTELESFSAPGLNVSGISNMEGIFEDCPKLEDLNLSGWDSRNLQNTQYMFSRCSALVSVNLSGWDTSKITTMYAMFQNASSLVSLDLSGWDTSNVTNTTSMFGYTHLKRLRLGAGTSTLASAVQSGAFPAYPGETVYVEGAFEATTLPDGSTIYKQKHFQSNTTPAGAYSTAVTRPTWFGTAKGGIEYAHADGTVGDYPHPCLAWTDTDTCTVAGSTGLTGSPSRRLSWIDGSNGAHIPGDTLTPDGLLTVTPQWNPMPVPTVTTVTWPHDLGGESTSIRATGTAADLRRDDTMIVRYTWTDATGTEQHKDTTGTIDGSDWTADLTDAPSLASMAAADLIGTGTKVTVTAQVKDAGGPLGQWSTGKDGYPDMVAPGISDSYATSSSAGGVAMSSDRSQAVAEPGDTVTISWLDNTDTPISWPDGGGTTTTLTVATGPGGHFSATKPIAVTGAKKIQYVLSDGINTSEPYTKKITDPITAIPLTGGQAQLWSKLLLTLLAVMLIGATTTLRNRRNHALRLVTPTGRTTPIPHGFTTNCHTANHRTTNRQTNGHRTAAMRANTSPASDGPSHAKLHHTAKHTTHGPRHTK